MLTRAEADSAGLRVDCIDRDDPSCQVLILWLALDAGRALHQRAAVLLHEMDRQHCAQLHPGRQHRSEALT